FSLSEATQSSSRPVAIIDEALAKKLWPDGDALGQRIQFASEAAPRAKRDDGGGGMGIHQGGKGNIKPEEPVEVVGIAGITRSAVFEKRPRGTIYVPFARGFQTNAFFFVHFSSLNKTTVPDMADALRRVVRENDP